MSLNTGAEAAHNHGLLGSEVCSDPSLGVCTRERTFADIEGGAGETIVLPKPFSDVDLDHALTQALRSKSQPEPEPERGFTDAGPGRHAGGPSRLAEQRGPRHFLRILAIELPAQGSTYDAVRDAANASLNADSCY